MSQEKTYNFPVFGTQGGGLVREIKTDNGYKYIFTARCREAFSLTKYILLHLIKLLSFIIFYFSIF